MKAETHHQLVCAAHIFYKMQQKSQHRYDKVKRKWRVVEDFLLCFVPMVLVFVCHGCTKKECVTPVIIFYVISFCIQVGLFISMGS